MWTAGNRSFPEKLANGVGLVGTWLTLTDTVSAEIAFGSGLDFVVIDGEHAPIGPETIHRLIGAARGSETSVLVRVPANLPMYVAYALDAGADGIIVPQVRSSSDVERAVAAARFPPQGTRGWGPRRPTRYGRHPSEYRSAANTWTAVIVQVELREAVDDLDQILAVPGLDAVFIGPNDLAGSLGYPGEPAHRSVVDVIESVIRTAADRGMPTGIACGADSSDIARWLNGGCQFVAAAADYVLLAEAFDRLARSKPEEVTRGRVTDG